MGEIKLVQTERKAAIGVDIAARLGALASQLIATASATYPRLGIGFLEAKVLYLLDRAPMTGSELSRELGIHRAAVSRTVKKLTERRYVEQPSLDSRRIALSEEGQRVRPNVALIFHEREHRLLTGFSLEDQALLVKYLDRLEANVADLSRLSKS